MYKNKLLIPVLLFLIVISPIRIYAEDFKDEEYRQFVEKAFRKEPGPTKEDYKTLRTLYTQTSFYDPNIPNHGLRTILKNLDKEDNTREQTEKYLDEMFEAMYKHMGNIDTHVTISNYFYNKGKEDLAEYNALFANRLAYIVYKTGDGLSPETAFTSINKSEEVFVIRFFLKRQYDSVGLQNINNRLYDVYQTYDPKAETKEVKPIYFDITNYYGKGVLVRELSAKMKELRNRGTEKEPTKPE